MKISWLGHSAFLLEESTGTKILTDPFSEDLVGYAMPKVSCDAVTVSHDHRDHNYLEGVIGEPQIIDTFGAYEVKGVYVWGSRSFHDASGGEDRGNNLIFKFRADGVEVCHMGDIGESVKASFVESIGTTNVLLIPIGGVYTIDAVQAKEYVDILMPDVVIPMHYKTKDCSINIAKLDDFLELFDEEQVEYLDGNAIELSRSYFDGEDTKVLVLKKPN